MLKKERHAYILKQINLHNKVLSTDLCAQLNVSEDTVRRDLQELHDERKLNKVHGGALSKSFNFTLLQAEVYAAPQKQIIAKKAASLIKDGMLVLLSGGTTILELVRCLPDDLNATFITVSLPVALELLKHPAGEVIFLGNKLVKDSQIAVGAEVIQRLAGINADLCFLGTNSIDPEKGITDIDWEVIEVKKAIIKAANKIVALSIAEKLNTSKRLQVCKLNEIDILITELSPNDSLLTSYIKKGIEVL